MNRLTLLAFLTTTFAARSLRGDTPELPTYTYVISAPSHQDGGVFMSAIHLRVPDTVWLCDITYGNAGLLMRCSTPRLEGGVLPEVTTRVSCKTADSDSATVHLSTLDSGVYALLNISCKRNLYDEGF